MDTDDQAIPPAADAEMPSARRPRPSWYLRWGKGTALWLCGFGVGAAVVYGAIWGKSEYDAYHALRAMHLPEPVRDPEVTKLFAPEEPPPAPPVAAAPPAVLPPEPAAAPVRAVRQPVKARAAKSMKRTQLAAQSRPRKVVAGTRSARLGDRRAAPRVLEIRRSSLARDMRRPCRRGDLARECYVVR